MNRVSVSISANCGTLAYRFREIISFNNQRPLGRWAPRHALVAVPGTNVFDAISSACGLRQLGIHVDNPEAFAAAHFSAGRRPR